MTTLNFKRINNDTNGNPRYVLHFLDIAKDYDRALSISRKLGGRKFHNKQFGGGIVFQSYNLSELNKQVLAISETRDENDHLSNLIPDVRNMESPSTGKGVPNQFVITTSNGLFFKSYNSMIAAKIGGVLYLDREKWDYSATTGKYRNQFTGMNIKETRQAIKEGRVILTNLNR